MTDAIHNFHPQYQQYTQYSSGEFRWWQPSRFLWLYLFTFAFVFLNLICMQFINPPTTLPIQQIMLSPINQINFVQKKKISASLEKQISINLKIFMFEALNLWCLLPGGCSMLFMLRNVNLRNKFLLYFCSIFPGWFAVFSSCSLAHNFDRMRITRKGFFWVDVEHV